MERGMEVVVTAIIFTALAGFFIILRCISRFVIVKGPGVEDWLIILSLVLSVATTIDLDLQRQNGLGRHSDTVSPEEVARVLELLFASIFTYNMGLFICKGSILYQYLRFFVQKSYRRAAYGLIAFIVAGGFSFLMATVFTCYPVAKSWHADIPGTCVDRKPLWYSFSSFNLLTDIAVLLLPIPVLWGLQLPRKQKISLIFVFALGGFGCIVSILRLHALYQASISNDLTYDNVGAALWSSVELNVAIMCACIPAMRPVISAVFPRLLSTTNRQTGSNPFSGTHGRSVGYYQRHDSVVELSNTRQPPSDTEEESLNFDTATMETGRGGKDAIHVKTEWTVTQNEHVRGK